MSSRELQLISRIIQTGELNTVLEWGIQPEDFRTGIAHSMYHYLLSYYSMPESKGSVIGPYASQQFFPHFQLCDDPNMSTAALCAEVRKNRVALELNERIDKIRQEIGSDPLGACARIQQLGSDMLQLGMGKSTDVYLGSAADRILHTYQMKKAGADFSMGHYPWSLLQKATGGIQKDDYIVFYGRPKSYKSWMLFYMAASLFMQDKKIIIYTKEMTPENVFMRIMGLLARIRYQEFRMADLSREEEWALYQARKLITYLNADDRIIVVSGKDASKDGDTVPWLESKVKTHQPHAVLVDGMYLMSDAKKNKDDHKKVKSISNDLRAMNLNTGVPILATIQANRKAAGHNEANLDELAFSDAIGQDATLIARVINEKDTPTAMLVLAGAREFTLNGLRINAQPAVNFEQYGVNDEDAKITAKDIEKAKDKDAGDADSPDAHANGKAKHGNGMRMTPGQELKNATERVNGWSPTPVAPPAHNAFGTLGQNQWIPGTK